uniref:Si:ch211-182p11.1 n=1 Tax=Amphiprion percula TaxID=161767 RepID=A0A3P8T4I3_AMPPE
MVSRTSIDRFFSFFPGTLYPIGGTTSARSLDGSSPRIALLRPFVYFGHTHNQIYVNHNGHLTFNAPWYSYIPQRFPMYGSRDIIAPFWTDIDIRRNGQINYTQYTNGTVLQQATRDINTYFPELNFTATLVFVATWYQVPYFPYSGTQTTFQAVLISDGRYSFVLMNYGIIATPTHRVEAGYDTINSTHHLSIPGTYLAQLLNRTAYLSNVNVPGRFAFRVDNGSRGCIFNGKWSDRQTDRQILFCLTSFLVATLGKKCHECCQTN